MAQQYTGKMQGRTKMTQAQVELRFQKAEFRVNETALTINTPIDSVAIFAKDEQLKELHKELGMYLEDKE